MKVKFSATSLLLHFWSKKNQRKTAFSFLIWSFILSQFQLVLQEISENLVLFKLDHFRGKIANVVDRIVHCFMLTSSPVRYFQG